MVGGGIGGLQILEIASDSGMRCMSGQRADTVSTRTCLRMRQAPQAENCCLEDFGWAEVRRLLEGGYGDVEADLEDEARCWDESDLGDIGHMRRGWSGDVHGEQGWVEDV